MAISDITIQDIKDYARVDYTDDDALISLILGASKSYIKNYTGLTDAALDEKEDLSIAYMVLCNELYSNKQYTVQNDKVNVVVKSILDMHSINLL